MEGCDYLLHAFVSDAIVEDGAVRGAVLSTKQGPLMVRAQRAVDATATSHFIEQHLAEARDA